jgi:predicted nucleic acid-binding protein
LILVDTNVLMGLMLQGGFSQGARLLLERDDDWHSEDLIFDELTNVLATQHRVAGLPLSRAMNLLSYAQELMQFGRHQVADADALHAAAQFGISGYDARFIVLARALGVKLTTEDRRLRAAVPDYTQSLTEALSA